MDEDEDEKDFEEWWRRGHPLYSLIEPKYWTDLYTANSRIAWLEARRTLRGKIEKSKSQWHDVDKFYKEDTNG